MFRRDCNAASRRTPASLARGEPASRTGRFTPLRGFVCLRPKHLNTGISPAKPRALIQQAHLCGIARIPPWHRGQTSWDTQRGSSTAARPRCAVFVHDPTLHNCKCFNIHAMSSAPHPLLLPCGDEFPLAAPRSWKKRQYGIKGFKLAQRR